jgi:Ca-activated chloride channel homolog
LMREATAHQITVTTVSFGKDADRVLMDAIAHWGQGRSYHAEDPLGIPRIFTAETILVSRALIEEKPFRPVVQTEHELLRGLPIAQAPPLYGYVVTYGKPAAELVLVTPQDDPLLAAQRYGLGRTVAFTADLGPRWGKDWMRWSSFPRFVAQMVRWIQRKSTAETFDARVEVQEGKGIVQAEVYDARERFVNHLHLEGKVLAPGRQTLPIAFTQTAPGRYQGRFPMQGRGDYLLTLVGKQGDTSVGPKTVGMTVPYSPEYLGLDINYSLLRRLAARTGGEVLQPNAPEDAAELLFASSGQSLSVFQDYWPWFVIAALCLFVGDIAVRQWPARRPARAEVQAPMADYTYADLDAIVHRRAAEHRRRSMLPRDAQGPATTSEERRRRG